MRTVAGVVMLAGLTAPAAAQEGPSFDCARALSAVEEQVCDFGDLAWLDRNVAVLYASAADGLDAGARAALEGDQQAFVAARDGCGDTAGNDLYACLHTAYSQRLGALAAGLPDNPSGVYDYQAEGGASGVLLLSVQPDGSAEALVSTVSTPAYNLCDVEIDGAAWSGGSLAWQSSEDLFGDGKLCRITIQGADGSLHVASEDCRGYCGHNAWFDGDYVRR